MQWTEISNGSGTGSVQRTFTKFSIEVQINKIYFNKEKKKVYRTFKESIVLHSEGLPMGCWQGKPFVSHQKTADSYNFVFIFKRD